MADAEEYAATLGVQADYGTYLLLGNMVNQVLTELTLRRLPLFSHVFVRTEFFERYGRKRRLVVARTEDTVLFVNPESNVMTDPVGSTHSLYASGFWSTPHPLHSLYHEVGHLFIRHEGEPKLLLPRQAAIASSVSIRAIENQEEFVSEVFAGLMSDVKYDKHILDLYRRLGGTRP